MDWPKPHQGVLAKRNVEHVKELHSWVSQQPEGDARLTLERILNTLKEEVARINLASSLRELGWAVRNIYELRVFARFVLQSDANLERFLTDYDVDGCEVAIRLGAFLKAHETYFPKVSTDIEELRELVESAKAYRQEKLHEHVQAQEISYRNVRGTHKSEFKVIGDDYFDDGRIIAWRCLLIENGRIVAENRSFMWE